jgi:hypothetical protein
VINPLGETVATVALLVDQVTNRPGSTALYASRGYAVAVDVWPMLSALGANTPTLTTGTAVCPETLNTIEAAFPSLVAVIVVLPTDSAVMRPAGVIEAVAGLLDVQVISRPANTVFAASRVTAVAVVVPPTSSELDPSAMLTLPTGVGEAAVTVNDALPLFPSEVAVMVTVPTAIAVTTPDGDTVATALLLELQPTARPVSTALDASRVVAAAVADWPTSSDGCSVTPIVAKGTTVTDRAADPLMLSLVAVMIAEPAPIAVTAPVDETVATAGLLDVQAITRPVSVLLVASRVTALAVVD